jgi:lipopolysaccharide transport system permease protein
MRYRNYGFLLSNLILKDFRIRYRNMSLGIFWSLVNPLVMMGVLTFVFTRLMPPNGIRDFALFVLCALVPFNFFTLSWANSTTSLVDNQNLIKRVRFPREIIPVSVVLANCLHFAIQIALLIVFAFLYGHGVNRYWALLPAVWGLEVVFVCGLAMATAALDVYVRDMRYVVESANVLLFWLVPIFYAFESIPGRFHFIYQYNPVSAVVLASRMILLEAKAPPSSLLIKLLLVSMLSLGLGLALFRRLRRGFADLV